MDSSVMERTAPTASQLVELDPSEFKNWVASRELAAREIGECISSQVEQQRLTPYEGGAVISALHASVFGYRQFHSELSPSDVTQTLFEAIRKDGRS